MGWSAARKLRRAVDGLTRVLAIEMLTAARALDLRAPLRPGPATGAVVAALRDAACPGPGPDRYLAPEIEADRRARPRRRTLTAPPSPSPARCVKERTMTAGPRPVRAPRGTDADRQGLAAGGRRCGC